jgi:uncharacterized SAM-dependent methyltransferase
LDEYYPTRSEHEIFRLHGPAIAEAVGQGTVLIDLGAGNCEKAAGFTQIMSWTDPLQNFLVCHARTD